MKDKNYKIAVVAPFPPPFGGMTILAKTMQTNLQDYNQKVLTINTNPRVLKDTNTGIIKKFLQLLKFIVSLRKLITCDVSVVISSSGNYFYSKAVPVLILGKLFRIPTVLDFVGGGVFEMIDAGKLRIVAWIKKFDLVIVPTTIFKNAFEKAGIQSEVFPHIVDIKRFSIAKKKSDYPAFLAAKNLEEYSNVASLIRAFAEIKKHKAKARFLIAGDGPERANLENLVEELKLSDVEFLGNKSYDEIPELFSKATIFLHGTKLESFGIVLVEAMASGTPIISTNVGGIPDLIQNGFNGLMVNYDDHMMIAKHAIDLLKDNEKYKTLVENGLHSSKQYAGDALSPKFIELMKKHIPSL